MTLRTIYTFYALYQVKDEIAYPIHVHITAFLL